jgi:hypothetical protein
VVHSVEPSVIILRTPFRFEVNQRWPEIRFREAQGIVLTEGRLIHRSCAHICRESDSGQIRPSSANGVYQEQPSSPWNRSQCGQYLGTLRVARYSSGASPQVLEVWSRARLVRVLLMRSGGIIRFAAWRESVSQISRIESRNVSNQLSPHTRQALQSGRKSHRTGLGRSQSGRRFRQVRRRWNPRRGQAYHAIRKLSRAPLYASMKLTRGCLLSLWGDEYSEDLTESPSHAYTICRADTRV